VYKRQVQIDERVAENSEEKSARGRVVSLVC